LYYSGLGVDENFTETLFWYRKAAAQGNTEAQLNLEHMHAKGYSTQRNYSEAALWYQEAADQGHSDAQYFLGCMHNIRKGVYKCEKKKPCDSGARLPNKGIRPKMKSS
jgi:hypothetical protein